MRFRRSTLCFNSVAGWFRAVSGSAEVRNRAREGGKDACLCLGIIAA